MDRIVYYPEAFPISCLHAVREQLAGKLNDQELAVMAAWNLIGYGLKVKAPMNLHSYSAANAPDDDESMVGLFDRAIAAASSEKPSFPWESLAPLIWHLIHRWRS